MIYIKVRNGLKLKINCDGRNTALHMVVCTHGLIDDALHLGVGFVPEDRVLRHADVTDDECYVNCTGGV